VPETPPVARSPIPVEAPSEVRGGWLVSTRAAVSPLRLADLTPLAKVHVRCDPDAPAAAALGADRGTIAHRGSDLVVGSGPGEWLLLGPPGDAPRITADVTTLLGPAVEAGAHVSVVDLTHGRALVRLTGEDAAATLAKLTAVDLRDRAVPDGTALRTAVARLAVDVVRCDVARPAHDGAPADGGATLRSYLLHCERSSGRYLAERVLDAGTEFGVEVDGFAWPVPADAV
jgi:heterotetrameric sarcosine oxidase gamma subunit